MSSAVTSSIVVLTGFMGSGKTTVGRALAELLGWEFIDLDEVMERREGLAIREIFAQRGESEFRQIEHMALRLLVDGCSGPTVIALGGGTFVQPQNERVLNNARVRSVYLEVPLEELLRRCGTGVEDEPGNPRPLAQDAARFRQLHDERIPFYRRAMVTIDAHRKTVEEIAREVAESLQLPSIF